MRNQDEIVRHAAYEPGKGLSWNTALDVCAPHLLKCSSTLQDYPCVRQHLANDPNSNSLRAHDVGASKTKTSEDAPDTQPWRHQ